ncbi:MAG: hypothetical protein QM754_05805 [Tepidisphaeraceae bacterium]
MHLIWYAFLFAWTVYTMQRHGIGRTFGLCLIPAVLLFNFAQSINMPLLPNITSLNVVLYGTLAGLVFRPGELRKIRWNFLDTCVVLLVIPVFITTFMNGAQPSTPGGPPEPATLKLAQRYAMEFACAYLFPYFMARIALQDADARRVTLKVLCSLSIFIGVLTAVESSGFRPNVTARTLYQLKLNTTTVGRPSSMVFTRFGMARAIATAGQQIDLGNVGVLVGTMILVLIPATGASWISPLSVGGILGAGAMVFGSVSMTSWFGMGVAFLCYGLFTQRGFGKYFVLPILVLLFGFMVVQTNRMVNEPPVGDRPGTDVGDSTWIRTKIMQDAWPMATDAGAFGMGTGADVSKVGVGSVDNSFLLFMIQFGWVFVALWLLMLFVAAWKGTQLLSRASTTSERLPAAAMVAGVIAITASMYTVYYGFCYANLFTALIGMVAGMWQMMNAPRPAAVSLHGGVPPHGYAMAGVR